MATEVQRHSLESELAAWAQVIAKVQVGKDAPTPPDPEKMIQAGRYLQRKRGYGD
ncbi:MAG: hypothetical protein QMC90_01750 [Dehalococcoidales bacterium]|nr:hypothetical protein [Dehalococcoidales bacterium]